MNLVYRSMRLLLLLFILLHSCSPKLRLDSQQFADTFKDGYYNKIAIVGLGSDIEARKEFEESTVDLFKKKGVNVIEGVVVFPYDSKSIELTPQEVLKIITVNNIDAILTMGLIRVDSLSAEERELSGGIKALSIMLALVSTSGNPDYQPGAANAYVIESVLYDLRGELNENKKTMVWSGQSTFVDPYSLEYLADSFSKELVTHITEEKIIQPPTDR